jgi:hypothetical protein
MSNISWSIVMLLGLYGWVIFTLLFIFKAFPEADKFDSRNALRWGPCILVFFFVWVAGLLNA